PCTGTFARRITVSSCEREKRISWTGRSTRRPTSWCRWANGSQSHMKERHPCPAPCSSRTTRSRRCTRKQRRRISSCLCTCTCECLHSTCEYLHVTGLLCAGTKSTCQVNY